MTSSLRRTRLNRDLHAMPSVIALASQVMGLVQIGLLLLRAGANEATDAYFYLFNLGLVPTFLLLNGILYPQLIGTGAPSRRYVRSIRVGTVCASGGLVLAGSFWLHHRGRLGEELAPLAAILIANALIQSVLYGRALLAEADGNASWSAGIAFPANVLACLSLLIPWSSPPLAATAMATGLLLGNIALCLQMARSRVGHDVSASLPERNSTHAPPVLLIARSGTSYGSQLLLSSIAVLLPPSSLTILNLCTKVVAAVSTTFTNAFLPRFINRGTRSPRKAIMFLRVCVLSLAPLGFVLTGIAVFVDPAYLGLGLLLTMWLISSSASSIAQRASYRFLPISVFLGPMIFTIACCLSVSIATYLGQLSLTVLLTTYGVLDLGAACLLLWSLRARRDSFLILLLCGVTAGVALTVGT